MGWIRYHDTFEPPAPRTVGVAFLLACGLGAAKAASDVWHDWHHHRMAWLTVVEVLVALYLVVLVCGAARRAWRAWQKTRGSADASKTV